MTSSIPGSLLLSTSCYCPADITPGVTELPPGCTGSALHAGDRRRRPTRSCSTTTPSTAASASPRRSFLDELTPWGQRVRPDPGADATSWSRASRPSPSWRSTCRPNGRYVTFMGYVAAPDTLDVSNANTPGVIDPTNPVTGAYYRAVAAADRPTASSPSPRPTPTAATTAARRSSTTSRRQRLSTRPATPATAPTRSRTASSSARARRSSRRPSCPRPYQTPGHADPGRQLQHHPAGRQGGQGRQGRQLPRPDRLQQRRSTTRRAAAATASTPCTSSTPPARRARTASACPRRVRSCRPRRIAYDPDGAPDQGPEPSNMCILKGFPTTLAKTRPTRRSRSASGSPTRPRCTWPTRATATTRLDATGPYTDAAASTDGRPAEVGVRLRPPGQWNLAYTLQSGLNLGQPVHRPRLPDRDQRGHRAAVGAGHRRPAQHHRPGQPRRHGHDLGGHLDGQRQRRPGRRPEQAGRDHRPAGGARAPATSVPHRCARPASARCCAACRSRPASSERPLSIRPGRCEHMFVSPATILHADLDSFYASVEQRDNPRLRGRPVIVGGGVVLAASYEAKARGVRTAMGGATARRLCPDAVVVPPRMSAYSEASKAVFAVFEDTAPLVEGLSIDEAFLDVRGLRPHLGHAGGDRGAPAPASPRARSACRSRSESRARSSWPRWRAPWPSPTACCVVPPDRRAGLPAPASGRAAVGRRAGHRGEAPRSAGITTVGQVALLAERDAGARCSAARPGRQLHALAHNYDPRPVQTRRRRRSIGAQRALGRRRRSPEELAGVLIALVDRVARRLRDRPPGRAGRWCCGCASTTSRAPRGPTRCARPPTRPSAPARRRAGCSAASVPVIERRGLTLIGIALTNLADAGAVQLVLPFDRARDLDAVVDRVRDRFGSARSRAARWSGATRGSGCRCCPTEPPGQTVRRPARNRRRPASNRRRRAQPPPPARSAAGAGSVNRSPPAPRHPRQRGVHLGVAALRLRVGPAPSHAGLDRERRPIVVAGPRAPRSRPPPRPRPAPRRAPARDRARSPPDPRR